MQDIIINCCSIKCMNFFETFNVYRKTDIHVLYASLCSPFILHVCYVKIRTLVIWFPV